MTENKGISFRLTNSEKCWLLIGVLLGIMLTIGILYVAINLPDITPIQRTGILCFFFGASLVYFLNKLEL